MVEHVVNDVNYQVMVQVLIMVQGLIIHTSSYSSGYSPIIHMAQVLCTAPIIMVVAWEVNMVWELNIVVV